MRMRVGGEPPPERTLALAFEQLCRQLERPFSATEIRAAAPPDDGRSMTLGGLLLAAERLGFKSREIEASPRNLAAMPPPFLLVGRRPGAGWLVRSRTGDHLVVVEPGEDRSSALGLETVADMAARAVLLKPLAKPAPQQQWRESILRRLKPVVWELALASVVINLLALATPIFLMTVYNKVDSPSTAILQRPMAWAKVLRCKRYSGRLVPPKSCVVPPLLP
jgi:ABC-type bacteriocin/lantibiotic exporter with double-glycine peptidase domain